MPDEQPSPSDAPRESALRRLLAPSRRQLVVALVVCIVTATTVITAREHRDNTSYDSVRRADLVTLLDSLSSQSNRLTAERDQLAATRTELSNSATAREAAQQANESRRSALEVLSGQVGATGPGIHVVITDPDSKMTPEVLIDAVQELRDAGAEAVEIDDSVRVVASTWFGERGGALIASGTKIPRPIRIDVIGDSQTLAAALQFRGGLVSTIEASPIGGRVTISQPDKITIDAVASAPQWRYAKPS